MQRTHASQPMSDGSRSLDALVGWLVIETVGLDGDVCLDGSAIVGPIQRIEILTNEDNGSVYGEFHDWDGCSFDEFNFFEARIVFESLL